MRDVARELGLQLRAGVHTGECDVVDGDIFGMTVNIAARVATAADADCVFASSTVRDLVIGSPLSFTSRGTFELKGVPGRWELVACDGEARQQTAYETDVRHPDRGNGSARQLRPSDRMLLASARMAPRTMRRVMARLNPSGS
jgi:class 3 adenylate cyclase